MEKESEKLRESVKKAVKMANGHISDLEIKMNNYSDHLRPLFLEAIAVVRKNKRNLIRKTENALPSSRRKFSDINDEGNKTLKDAISKMNTVNDRMKDLMKNIKHDPE